jgi:hypothetical protein
MLRDIRKVASQELRWVQPQALRSEYELQIEGQVAARLAFPRALCSDATGECADGRWTFRRHGFLKTRVSVRALGSGAEVALFRHGWGSGGTIETPDGRRFTAVPNFWATRYELRTPEGTPLVTLGCIGGLFHLSSNLLVHEAARSMPELGWVVLLAWYLVIMMQRDSAVAISA